MYGSSKVKKPKKKAPAGFHYMPNGKLMKDSDMKPKAKAKPKAKPKKKK